MVDTTDLIILSERTNDFEIVITEIESNILTKIYNHLKEWEYSVLIIE